MLEPKQKLSYWSRQAYLLGEKLASDATPSYGLTGLLYLSELNGKPFGLLSVPNAMVRGVFDALHVPGIELPFLNERLNAHITVFRPEELESIGGADKIQNDRGKPFRYSLGRLVEFEPAGWQGVEKVWAIRVHSPELQELRRSHGLSSLPNNGEYDFHISVAVKHRGVLARNEKAKGTAAA